MATAMNYVKTYSDALAASWPYVLHFGALYATPNNGRYRFGAGKSIEIPTISTSGRVDSQHEGNIALNRNYENSWETKELTNRRMWSTVIHPADIDQTNMALTLSNITSVFNSEHKFPEMDAYCVSKIYADWTGYGNIAGSVNLTASNFLSYFDLLMQEMTEAGVPVTGRYLYVTPGVMSKIKSITSLNRNLNLVRDAGNLTRVVTVLDGVTVIEVPSRLMKTAYTFGEGFEAKSDAKQIQMMLIHPEAVLTPVSYETAQLDEPSAVSGGKYVYYEESYEDVFLLKNRANGVKFLLEE